MKKVLALVAVVQVALVAIGVSPQLSARIAGDDYRMLVQPVDPIDPFRGAYVDLDYPGLDLGAGREVEDGESGALYVLLVERDGLWELGSTSRTRPTDDPYLACDDRMWQIRCGIESWFVPQDEALALEDALREDGAIATIKVDSRGNAAITALDPR